MARWSDYRKELTVIGVLLLGLLALSAYAAVSAYRFDRRCDSVGGRTHADCVYVVTNGAIWPVCTLSCTDTRR